MVPPPADIGRRQAWLRQQIDQLLAAAPRLTAKLGIAVIDVDSGRLVYGRNEALLLNPASNVKMVTTAAALALLGPEYRFRTTLHGDVRAEGPLYLRGYGDPTLQAEDLWRLAAEAAARGVKKATDLVIDDTFFDEQRVAPAFEQKAEDAPFRAPQGAVSLGHNAVGIRVLPGATEGAPARVVVEPDSPYIVVKNTTRTIGRGRQSIVVESAEGTEGAEREHTVVKVRGAIRLGAPPQEFAKRVAHPDLYTGYTLREILRRHGVRVTGKVTRGATPEALPVLSARYSAPLGVLCRDTNKRSNNFMAEQIMKTLGAEVVGKPGTWDKGVEAVGRYLDSVGVPAGRYKLTNGSGLYDANRFSAGQMAQLLRAAYRDFRYAADFVGSLAVAGADGTVGHRMSGGLAERYVRAKTGTLLGVSTLSGYASAPLVPLQSGQPARGPLAFSLLMNDLPDDAGGAARGMQDAIAELLVRYLGGPGLVPPAPPVAAPPVAAPPVAAPPVAPLAPQVPGGGP